MQLVACQLDMDQLLTLAACMAEESLYERADSRLDYMKLGIELQSAITRLPNQRPSPPAAPAAAASEASEADVTGLLALAQSSVEQKQSELPEWGQRSAMEDEAPPHSLVGEETKKRKRDRPTTIASRASD